MKVSYKDGPVEGEAFHLLAQEVAGKAKFEAFLNGQLLWQHECPDPPCHEEIRVPEEVAGGTLFIVVRDDQEEHELTFFINDDGRGLPQEPRVKHIAPA